jgi:riboflavin biosynthesis pyrimidine reductase
LQRPEIVVIAMASVDGKITTAPGRNVTEWTALGLDGGAHDVANRLCDDLDCDGMISGSESILVYGSHPVQLDKALYWPQKSKGFIVIDGRGRVEWAQTDGLVVVTRDNVSATYMGQLREKRIDSIQAGRGEHVDLHLALDELYQRGFRRLALTGGGALNGAFLRAGLVDEVCVVIAPCIVGSTDTPGIFDCPELKGPEGITRVVLVDSGQVGEGAFWLRYRIFM